MKNKKFIYINIGLVLLIGVFLLSKPIRQLSAKTIVITMNEEGFEPRNLSIKKGTRVVFKNNDNTERWPASNLHPTHEDYSEFDPQRGLKPAEEWGFIFDRSGEWKFHDHLIPHMRGSITVTE